jgi:hypothetical protein
MPAVTPADVLADATWEDQVLSPRDTAKQLGCSEFTLLRMRQRPNSDGLPWVRLTAGRIGYRRGDIRAYLLARRVGTTPEQAPEQTPAATRGVALPFAKPSGRGRPKWRNAVAKIDAGE